MARYEFKLPDIGEGVAEGEIVSWLVRPGDVVNEDQPMVEVMTDKATVTIASPKSGRIVETVGSVGEVVKVHAVLVVFELGDGAAEAPGTNGVVHQEADEGPAATAVGDLREDLPGMKPPAKPGVELAPRALQGGRSALGSDYGSGAAAPVMATTAFGATAAGAYFNAKPLATPSTRQLARNLGLDLCTVAPSGPGGRVTSDDVRSWASATARASAAQSGMTTMAQPAHAQGKAAFSTAAAPPDRVPLRGVRKRVFEHMARSKREAAHFTFVEECDMTRMKDLKDRMKPRAEAAGVKVTFLPFIIKAVVVALKRHPALNASFDEKAQEIVTHRHYNVGIATATDAGLMVPVVKDADQRSIVDIAREIERLSQAARAGKASLADLSGSTFTVTSLGSQGGLFATPIINYPEVAILGVHQIKKKPVVRKGEIVIGDVMLLSLSFDHRLIDGHVGAAFAYEVIRYIEDPESLLLEMI